MNWTAYLHPAFAEEVALLPADLRISFFSQLMLQEGKGALSSPLDLHYPHEKTVDLGFHTRFHFLDTARKYLACFDTKFKPEAFVYLWVGEINDDISLCEKASQRLNDIKTGKIEPLKFQYFFHAIADRDEVKRATKINADIAYLAFNQYLLAEAYEAAKKEAATIFNLCAPQMDRLLIRFDLFFSMLQQKLRERGGSAALEIAFKSAEPRLLQSFKELSVNPINKSEFD